MATKKPNALSFCRTYLRRSPKATYAQVKKAADKKKIKLWPISYGRAQALEGIVKSKPRGSGKTAKKKAKTKVVKKRGRPKGSKNKKATVKRGRRKGSKNRRKRGVNLSSLDGLVSILKTLERDRDDAQKTLAKIRELLG